MLLSVALTVTPTERTEAPAELGYAVHEWFLRAIGAVDRHLAATLHDDDGRKPFTASNLWNTGRPHDGRVSLLPGRPCCLRLTALTRPVAEALTQALPRPGVRIEINYIPFEAQAVAMTSASDAWAGGTTYQQLMARHLAAPARPPQAVALRFASPTLFRATDHTDLPLPLAAHVYRSYLDKWNAFAPQKAPQAVKGYIEKWVALGRFDIRSRFVSFRAAGPHGPGTDGKGGHVGFTGTARFRFRGPDPICQRWMALLSAYAFWCGTGYRTSDGFGQTCLAAQRARRRNGRGQGASL